MYECCLKVRLDALLLQGGLSFLLEFVEIYFSFYCCTKLDFCHVNLHPSWSCKREENPANSSVDLFHLSKKKKAIRA